MKTRLYLVLTCAALLGALLLAQVQRVEAPPNPAALLHLVADTQRELTRLPVEFTRIPDKDEIAAGNQMAGSRDTAPTDREGMVIQKYVEELGKRLSTNAGRKLPYQFHFIPDPNFINAFALPGGHVFIGSGLISLMETEEELATVLGHEIEHIDHYHCAERLQWELALRKLPLGSALQLPAQIFQAGYTKEQELEADREGVRLAMRAGYSPLGAIRVFEQLERLRGYTERKAKSPQQEISQVAVDILRGYFRSHPPPNERIEQIRRTFGAELAAAPPARPLQVLYYYIRLRAAQRLEAAHSATARRRTELFREAAELAQRSLALKADQPPALRILAAAQLGLSNFTEAEDTYRKLLRLDAAEADAVRAAADAQATRALGLREFKQAAALAQFSLKLQPARSAALGTLALSQIGLDDYAAAQSTLRDLEKLYPGAARELANQIEPLGRKALADGDFRRARTLFSMALDVDPDFLAAREQLAEAQFASADFAAAASSYRELLDDRGVSLEMARRYAHALVAAGNLPRAAPEFRAMLAEGARTIDAAMLPQLRVELAGLLLLVGDNSLAAPMLDLTAAAKPGFAPEHMGRLGWWLIKAGRAAEAITLLENSIRMRPGDTTLATYLGWAKWEAGKNAEALEQFERAMNNVVVSQFPALEMPSMGRALVNWLRGQSDAALEDFGNNTRQSPAWLNPAWVRGLHTRRVADVVADLHAARQAEANFREAKFAQARDIYRALLARNPADAGLIRKYAIALGAAGPAEGAAEFSRFADAAKLTADAQQQARLDLAGLQLVAGNSAAADALAREWQARPASAGGSAIDPAMLERLAWWYLWSGSTPPQVEAMLRALYQQNSEARVRYAQRPEAASVINALGWLELERGNLPGARAAFTDAAASPARYPVGNTPKIGLAIVLWRTSPQERQRALRLYREAAIGSPWWLDSKWVAALYPAHVARTIQELHSAMKAADENLVLAGGPQD